jgi:hypothetical protein
MTIPTLYGANLGDLLQYGDYQVISPQGAWTGAGTAVHVLTADRGGVLWQTGGDAGSVDGFERMHLNGIWGDWAATGSATVPAVQAPAPTLASISPTTFADDAGSHNLTLAGTGFVRGCTVAVAGSTANGALTFTSATSLTRAVNAAHASIVAGSFAVQVTNPDGKASNAVVLVVT